MKSLLSWWPAVLGGLSLLAILDGAVNGFRAVLAVARWLKGRWISIQALFGMPAEIMKLRESMTSRLEGVEERLSKIEYGPEARRSVEYKGCRWAWVQAEGSNAPYCLVCFTRTRGSFFRLMRIISGGLVEMRCTNPDHAESEGRSFHIGREDYDFGLKIKMED